MVPKSYLHGKIFVILEKAIALRNRMRYDIIVPTPEFKLEVKVYNPCSCVTKIIGFLNYEKCPIY